MADLDCMPSNAARNEMMNGSAGVIAESVAVAVGRVVGTLLHELGKNRCLHFGVVVTIEQPAKMGQPRCAVSTTPKAQRSPAFVRVSTNCENQAPPHRTKPARKPGFCDKREPTCPHGWSLYALLHMSIAEEQSE